MRYPIDTLYVPKAKEAFDKLLTTFPNYAANGWRVGNVFDTLTDYLLRYPHSEPSPGTVAQMAWTQWNSPNVQNSMCWYDDYGWWGIASTKAFLEEYASIFGSTRNDFKKLAQTCWTIMYSGKPAEQNKLYRYRGAPNVWENKDEGNVPGYFSKPDTWAKPRFLGGVWQYDMFKDQRAMCPEKGPCDREVTECSYYNPCDPSSSSDHQPSGQACSLGPYQLTVMNGLFLILASRMHQLEAARNERGFLEQWFALDEHKGNEQGLLLRFPPKLLTLVRERVPTYAYCEPKGTCPDVQHYASDAIWCGDQGLILGGLLDYLVVDPSDPNAQPRAISIAGGVLRHMVKNQVVQPTWNLYNDPEDYESGSGVFWRYLLRGFRANNVLREQVLTWIKEDPSNDPIYRSAEAACTPINASDTEDTFFADFNVLATLTTAIEILRAAET